ncbi:MAG TPA: UDP-N-acetylmuramate dehydrogenase [Phycisphaerae bacterium]|nr:UDP-N-acetylmuramate dehydrogenase [Phycisphaerae bacterium]
MTTFKGLDDIVREDFPLGSMTTFGVGGKAQYFVRPRTEDELRETVERCAKKRLNIYTIGRGSNVLVRDEGVEGAVIQLDPKGFGRIGVEEDLLRAGAAAPLSKVVAEAARHSLSGIECLVGIPGSVGGGVRMNAGGAYGDIGQTVERVKVMDAHGETFHREREDLAFGYRTSNVSARFILEAELRLLADSVSAISKRMKTIWIAKKNSQPMSAATAGCAFKNPRGLAAGLLIDQAGLKGTAVGGAAVSHKHANYIVVKDRKKTKAADVLDLIELVRKAVKDRFDVYLELEIEVWP